MEECAEIEQINEIFVFFRLSVVKASEVCARSAVIVWKTSTVVYHSYKLIYQVVGEETKVNSVCSDTYRGNLKEVRKQLTVCVCAYIRR